MPAMATPAAIQATYADYRRVKGRKCLQIILEVPLEMAPQVHEVFGEPLPDGSTWVAVARINPAAPQERKGGKLAQKAALISNQGGFQKYIGATNADEAAEHVRKACGITSRADLDHNESAAAKFRDLETSYEAWLKAA